MAIIVFEGLSPESKTLHYILKSGTRGDMIITDKKGKRRAIRYCSNQPSIFIDEQVKPFITPSIVMEEGYLRVDDEEQETLLEFLRSSPQFNKDYREVDPERDAQEALEYEELLLSIKGAFLTKSQEKFGDVALASLLIMNSKKNYTPAQIDEMGPSQIRQALYTLAEADAEAYMQGRETMFFDTKGKVNCFSDSRFLRNDIVIRSLAEGLITVSPTGRQIFWGSGEELIDVPTGKNYREYLADFFLSKEGEKVMQTLATDLEKASKSKK